VELLAGVGRPPVGAIDDDSCPAHLLAADARKRKRVGRARRGELAMVSTSLE
jgi:hypothetical protein